MAKSKNPKAKKSTKFIGMSKLALHVADYLNSRANVDTSGAGRIVFLHDVIHSVVRDIMYTPKDEPVNPQSADTENGVYSDTGYNHDAEVGAVFISVYRKAVTSSKFIQALRQATSAKNEERFINAQGDYLTIIGGFNDSYLSDNYQYNGIIYKNFDVAPISLYSVPRVTNLGDETTDGIITLPNS